MLKFSGSREKEYIQRIKTDDRTVLGELFIEYQRMIYGYILKNGGNKNDAEDVLQETIIVLWQKVNSDSLQLTVKLGTYLMAIAKNKWMAELRKRNRIVSQEIPDHIPDGNPNSLESLLSKEKIESVRMALEMLQPICKKLLLLYYFEEKSMKEISKILNLANTDVAKSKKYQCKKNFEEILEDHLNESEGDIE